jgi:hypothetical protein
MVEVHATTSDQISERLQVIRHAMGHHGIRMVEEPQEASRIVLDGTPGYISLPRTLRSLR